ncbi:Ureidoglycolate lyase [Saitozyma podzolica]|uniref:Ureidoglycolate lyase n=1 Tax=Saitozyma podzolica TaxID=1890683 RepID=A0A427XTH1_9TREE|nr:Ureidoglycolate lyase [Saitozyma podzolica]
MASSSSSPSSCSRIVAIPLTVEVAHPKLGIISPLLTNSRTKVGNQGTSTKTPNIVPCTNTYHLAPSGRAGRPVMSSSRNKPRETIPVDNGADGVEALELQVGVLERHPYSSQSFTPMGGDECVSYVVLVADSDQTGTRPDPSTVRAFTVLGTQGVCYDAGLWHAPMAVVGKTMDFAIFQFMNGVEEEDCEMVDLAEPLRILLSAEK